MTSKQMAAIAWDNMKLFDWALQKYNTETKFEQYIMRWLLSLGCNVQPLGDGWLVKL